MRICSIYPEHPNYRKVFPRKLPPPTQTGEVNYVTDSDNGTTWTATAEQLGAKIDVAAGLVVGREYLLLAKGAIHTETTDNTTYVRLRDKDDNTLSRMLLEPANSTSNRTHPFFFCRHVIPATSDQYYQLIHQGNGSSITKHRSSIELFALDLTSLALGTDSLQYNEPSSASPQSLTATYADVASKTFTPTEDGDYLIIGTNSCHNPAVIDNVYTRTKINGGAFSNETYQEQLQQGEDTAEEITYGSIRVVSLLKDTQYTVSVQSMDTAPTATSRYRGIYALRLTGNFSSWQKNYNSNQYSTSLAEDTNWEPIDTTWTPTEATSHLIMGSMVCRLNTTAVGYAMNILPESIWMGNGSITQQHINGEYRNYCQYVLDTSITKDYTYYLKHRLNYFNNGPYNAYLNEGSFVALALAPPA